MRDGVYKAPPSKSDGQADQQQHPGSQPNLTSAPAHNMSPEAQAHALEAVGGSQPPCAESSAAVLSELVCQEEADQAAAPDPCQTVSQKRRKKERQRLLGVCRCLAQCHMQRCRQGLLEHCLDVVVVSEISSSSTYLNRAITLVIDPHNLLTSLLNMHHTQYW